ncbi:hypothetical protein CH333_08655 [candidate division WOR-3 bacterium JGI_Cruoil_03_44_89]|uniref:OmpA-like domain-containing protein n=1 Tax=candidate division WOR-3 bacterium JGI_Cruoil_03_44_89 TaxID=1973748 RepID=A0A235BP21_UNCW3|nr:MAG: hypothetical protein CH333_08655 [candidate division WOR-3 bacterium JGI_Cruoil_03_44_89]
MGILNLLITAFLLGSGAGTTAFPLLKVACGPRACGMGESFTALSDDATSIFWNPGGLANLKNTELFFTHHEWFQDIRDENLIFALKTPRGTFGSSLLVSSVDNIESRGPDQRKRESLNFSSGIFTLSYGIGLGRNLSVGMSLKGFYDDLGEVTGSGWGMDFGGIYKLYSIVNLGLNLYNLGPDMDYERENIKLPSGIRTGVCIQPEFPVSLLLDFNFPRSGKVELHSGGEVWITNVIALRGGYRNGPQDTELGGFTCGLGIRWEKFNFDYAYVPYGDLGNTHRVSLAMLFPPIKRKTCLLIKVIDSETRVPLRADLKLSGNVSLKATTDSLRGEYKIVGIPEGITDIDVIKGGYHIAFDSAYTKEYESRKKLIELRKIKPGILKGLVLDAERNNPVPALVKCDGKEIKTDDNGVYSFELSAGIYRIEVFPDDTLYIKRGENVSINESAVMEKNFYLLKKKVKLIFDNIHFETAKADIMPDAHPTLDNIGRILAENPELELFIAGHTDSRRISTPEFHDNWALSRARAEAVKDYLVEKFAIEPTRLKTEGYAHTIPLVPNNSPENMAKNRRVEFTIMKSE